MPSEYPLKLQHALVLIGMMASGKTTTGRIVADKLGWRFLDNDQQIADRSGRPPADLLRTDPQRFRDLEAELIMESLRDAQDLVLSLGGGAVERESTRQQLHNNAVVVWLRAPVEVLLERVASESQQRPMLDGDPVKRMQTLSSRRTPIYESLADFIVDVDEVDAEGAASRVIEVVS